MGTILALNAGFLLVVLVILVCVWAFMVSPGKRRESDWEEIKHEIEHEAEVEAEEELMPYKPPRLDRPTQRRL